MKIVVAPDSFKGSLTSVEVSNIMKDAILDVNKEYDVIEKPMADGGEGTLQTLQESLEADRIPITCTGPLGKKIHTMYAIKQHTAIIECANIAGLPQVPMNDLNPDHTTTYGIGEVIMDALDKGCTSIIIGLGGSATNDGGLGMLQALGMKASDHNGKEVGLYGKDLHAINKVSFTQIDPRLTSTEIKVACDVDNPLCGEKGASEVYGPQKGATHEQIQQYDQSLDKYGKLIEHEINKTIKETAGAGAAGGLGFALLAIGGKLVSGAALVADALDVEREIKNADIVMTGEGKSDEQTLYGKAPGYIATLARKHRIPTILISGSLADVDKLNTSFASCFSIIDKPMHIKECIEQAEQLLYEQAKQVIHLVAIISKTKHK